MENLTGGNPPVRPLPCVVPCKLYFTYKKIILVEKSMKPRRDENGYIMMGVKEFLLDANSLDCSEN